MRLRNLHVLTAVVILSLSIGRAAEAQTSDSLKLEQLQEEVYRHYSSRNTKAFMKAVEELKLKPAEIATSMNNELALNNENGMFVTMFIGLLDLVSGRLDFCNAGHNPPVLNGDFIEMEPNAPLGLWENLNYEGEALEYIKDKQFFVYSDGLNEAENGAQDQYSDDRLLSFLKGHTEMAAHPLIDLLMADVEQHVNGADPSDDMTMLCLRMK